MNVRSFVWDHGDGEVQSLGGMLGPVRFRLPGAIVASPFHIAPWADEPAATVLPGILRRLRGEWPCVPFGAERDDPLAGEWAMFQGLATDVHAPPHGHGSNHEWMFGEDLSLSIDYPADNPISRLQRRIRPDPAAPAIDIDLTIQVRRDTVLPFGLHPTFRLPDSGVVIETGSGGMTFPAAVEPGVSILAQGAAFGRLDNVPLLAGGHADLSRLPLKVETEELLQLTQTGGCIAIVYPGEGYRIRMTWDPSHFPGLVVWLSNYGRAAYPWSSRHRAVGIEPVCAAFDLGQSVSANANPLSQAGHPTARSFLAGEVFKTTLRIEAEPTTR